MKKLVLIAIAAMFSFTCFAVQKAMTDKGEEVLLYDNGTWKFANERLNKPAEFKYNKKKYYKSKKATFELKSKKNDVAVWLDPKKWSFSKSKSNSEAEYQFQLKGADLHGLLISEAIEIKVETLVNIALENAKRAAPDARIVSQEYRTVNGLRLVQLNILGTIQGIKFSYLGYYYSNSKGTTQLLTFTSENLFPKYRKAAETFLNGLTRQ